MRFKTETEGRDKSAYNCAEPSLDVRHLVDMVDVVLIEVHIVDENVRVQLVLVELQIVVVVLSVGHQPVSHAHPHSHVHAGDADVGRWRHACGRQWGGRDHQVAAVDPMQTARDAGATTLQMPATGAETRCSMKRVELMVSYKTIVRFGN